jgi:hypothetical protein
MHPQNKQGFCGIKLWQSENNEVYRYAKENKNAYQPGLPTQ